MPGASAVAVVQLQRSPCGAAAGAADAPDTTTGATDAACAAGTADTAGAAAAAASARTSDTAVAGTEVAADPRAVRRGRCGQRVKALRPARRIDRRGAHEMVIFTRCTTPLVSMKKASIEQGGR